MSTSTPASETPAPPPAAPPEPDRRAQWLSGIGFALIALIGVLVVLYAWRLPPFTSPIVSTENATVRGQVTVVGSQLPAYVADVKVQDFQFVHKGDLLVELDSRIYRQRYEQAQAQLAAQKAALANWEQSRASARAGIDLQEAVLSNAQAQAARASADYVRAEQLVGDGSLSVRTGRTARCTGTSNGCCGAGPGKRRYRPAAGAIGRRESWRS